MTTDGILPVKFIAVNAGFTGGVNNVSWIVSNEVDIEKYIVESSANGINFIEKGILSASGSSSYLFADRNLTQAAIYYRIKAVDKSGGVLYSAIVKMPIANTLQIIEVYPNPLVGRIANIHLSNGAKETYQLLLLDNVGKTIFTKTIRHNGGTASYEVVLPLNLVAGNYRLMVKGNASTTSKSLIIQ